MHHRLAALGVAAFLAGGPALAQAPGAAATVDAFSTAELADRCRAQPNDARGIAALAWCHGYIDAAGDYHAATHPAGRRGAPAPLLCLPTPPPSVAQVAAAFASWAAANPQYANEPSIDGLFRFARQAYPCPTPAAARPARRS